MDAGKRIETLRAKIESLRAEAARYEAEKRIAIRDLKRALGSLEVLGVTWTRDAKRVSANVKAAIVAARKREAQLTAQAGALIDAAERSLGVGASERAEGKR